MVNLYSDAISYSKKWKLQLPGHTFSFFSSFPPQSKRRKKKHCMSFYRQRIRSGMRWPISRSGSRSPGKPSTSTRRRSANLSHKRTWTLEECLRPLDFTFSLNLSELSFFSGAVYHRRSPAIFFPSILCPLNRFPLSNNTVLSVPCLCCNKQTNSDHIM